jgi:hypothetical protein
MSDINLNSLDWILVAFGLMCVLAPPVVFGLMALLLRLWVRRTMVVIGLYLGLSIISVFAVLVWLLIWLNLPGYALWILPLSVVSPSLLFGIYLGLRWLAERTGRQASDL